MEHRAPLWCIVRSMFKRNLRERNLNTAWSWTNSLSTRDGESHVNFSLHYVIYIQLPQISSHSALPFSVTNCKMGSGFQHIFPQSDRLTTVTSPPCLLFRWITSLFLLWMADMSRAYRQTYLNLSTIQNNRRAYLNKSLCAIQHQWINTT